MHLKDTIQFAAINILENLENIGKWKEKEKTKNPVVALPKYSHC